MKKYIKNNSTLINVPTTIKVCNSLPQNAGTNELVLLKNRGIWQKMTGGSWGIRFSNKIHTERKVGTIIPFYGNTIPNGYLECDGGTFSSTAFSQLYSLLGTTTLPDFRECVLRGSTTPGTFSDDSLIAHTHTISGGSHTHTYSSLHCHCMVASCGTKVNATMASGSFMASTAITYCTTVNSVGGCCGAVTPEAASTGTTITGVSGYTVDNTITRDAAIGVRFLIYTGEN